MSNKYISKRNPGEGFDEWFDRMRKESPFFVKGIEISKANEDWIEKTALDVGGYTDIRQCDTAVNEQLGDDEMICFDYYNGCNKRNNSEA